MGKCHQPSLPTATHLLYTEGVDFTVRLKGGLPVSANGRELSPPPDQAVAVLFFGLIAANGGWISRSEASQRLYPDSDPATARNALRQALFRLRRWLGADVAESRSGLLRLMPGKVSCLDEDDASRVALVSWLDHPWAASAMDARRRRTSVSHLDDFARAVESTAAIDPDAARSLLVGGSALALSMSPEIAMRLVVLTKPRDPLSPLAFEHLALCAELQMHSMSYHHAKANYGNAYRLAVQGRSRSKAFRAASMSAFAHIEAGDMRGAATWLDRCAEIAKTHPEGPLFVNARAAFLWNAGNFGEAVSLMRASAPSPDAADGSQLLHYWTNFAMLASESGDFETAIQADEEARGLARSAVHGGYLQTLELARSTRLMNQGRHDESLRAFEALREKSKDSPPDARLYAEEGYAEALARAGEVRRAAEVWSKAEAERLATTARLTPRLTARKRLIFQTV